MAQETLGIKCSECGYIHPIPESGICPMSNAKNIKLDDGRNLDFTDFIDKINKICISQVKMKNIKNIEKLQNFIIIEITKAFEKYE